MRTQNERFIPPELADKILDYLWDDPAALAACSLTCRAWVFNCRSHLFRKVDLTRAARRIRFAQVLSTSTGVGEHVRELTISGTILQSSEHAKMLHNLRGVKRLFLRNWDAGKTTREAYDTLQKLTPSITTLHLLSVIIDQQDFARLLSECRKLNDVRLWDVRVRTDAIDPPLPTTVAPTSDSVVVIDTLSSLTITSPAALAQMSDKISIRLRQLEVNCQLASPQSVERAKTLLCLGGPTLQSLVFTLRAGSYGPSWSDQLHFADIPNLTSLHLKDGMMSAPQIYTRRAPEYSLRWVCPALAQIDASHSHLQKIQISLRVFRAGDLDSCGLDWARLDDILAHIAKAHPRLVAEFCVCCTDAFGLWAKQAVDLIRAKTPQLCAASTNSAIVCCRGWTEEAALGGGVVGPSKKHDCR
ncbi:hypothetical protein WOLCODRAFT_107343 [Wolfiporia cocos MD-104 SS10]|uniref:F-box domain-containing protein n=1 Tax=Wolfiporia cocos (strain MD-104) TaxID=742152 RepID=A0A2H3J113_WOLCO|nr:hypothetical protein WOLCODRAFT_107343 [Wolfiporia cocos MD-104 SS10]